MAVFAALNFTSFAHAVSTDIVISEFRTRGPSGGNDEFIELYNLSNSPVDISGWKINGSSSAGVTGTRATIGASTVLNPGCRFLATNSAASGYSGGVVGNLTYATGIADNGGLAILNASNVVIDAVGMAAASAYKEGTILGQTTSNANQSQERKVLGQNRQDTDDNANDFSLNSASSNPQNLSSACTPLVSGNPFVNLTVSSNSGSEAGQTQITVTATASAAVTGAQTVNLAVSGTNITAGDYTLSNSVISIPSGGTSGSVTFTVVDDNAAEGAETAILTISNPSAGITLGTATQNISIADNDTAITPISAIQGAGSTSPLLGQTVTTSGVVTKLTNNGFFLQSATGDGNPATSDAILVFTSTAPTVSVGQAVQLTGTVVEFNTGAAGNADTLAHTVTELTGPVGITVLSSGNSITPTVVTFPEVANDDLEKVEGMLVTLNGPLTASQNFFQGRYGQVTLSANGRLENPTNKFRPNTAQALALADTNARSRILLDDGTSVQNPNPTPYIGLDNTLRAGDTVASLTGVIDYGLATNDNTKFGDYKIHPTQAPSFARVNARTAAPDSVGGSIKVASFNVLNYFTTFSNGQTASGQVGQGCAPSNTTADCRGADTGAEFTRQRTKIIAAIQAINADVVGLMEIQNNGNTAAQNLVDGLNAGMGAGTYAVLPLPAQGTGTDAIRVAMIYKPAALTLSGASASDVDAINNRPTLLQKFTASNGQQFAVAVNHFKSKGSCPASGVDADQGDGQSCWNNLRTLQSQRLRTWLSANGAGDTLIIGDLNAYGLEDPIFDLTGNGYVDEVSAFNSFGYSYVFDGNAGRLDHALASTSMVPKITGVKLWHVNADEPSIIDYNLEFKQPACATCGPDYYSSTQYRSSDHDPVVIGINLDFDGDGLSDAQELALGTSSLDLDSDDDGIADGVEDANRNGVVDVGETNPALADTDGDGIQDGTESGVSAGVADPDGAGQLLGTDLAVFVPDADPATTSSAVLADTDGDGSSDGAEDINRNGRLDAGEYDPLSASSVPPATTKQVPMLPNWAMLLFAVALAAVQRTLRRR
ncbi:MAG: hypothetical protein BVN35_08975 [Proteobacteria bacterium ST_bin11]|nr:MAG: hypothetical protein BVN35_08975 [Proteobacteria bacterium ST_bin11]